MDGAAMRQLASDVVTREAAAVSSIAGQLGDGFEQTVRTLFACEGKVLVSGSGTSHAVALRFAHLLSCVGTPALFLHPGDGQHGSSGALGPTDVWVGVSKGGETAEVNILADIARLRGTTVVAITEAADSSLGRLADVVLSVTSPQSADPFGMISTGSSLVTGALCDAICVVLLELRGYSADAFGETHPGGAVGLRIRQARGR